MVQMDIYPIQEVEENYKWIPPAKSAETTGIGAELKSVSHGGHEGHKSFAAEFSILPQGNSVVAARTRQVTLLFPKTSRHL